MNRHVKRNPQSQDGPDDSPRALLVGYAGAAAGVAAATAVFWLVRGALDKELASLLYLPVVVACATRFGFGPAVLAAVGSFVCWNYFFLPPFGSWTVQYPKDWLALIIFLVVALATARLSAQARAQTQEAQAREREARVLQRASEEISGEVETDRILPVLARQLVRTCDTDYCLIYRRAGPDSPELIRAAVFPTDEKREKASLEPYPDFLMRTHEHGELLGFRSGVSASKRPVFPPDAGVFAPLIADGQRLGVVHVGPRHDGHAFSPPQERLILAVANNAAVALARQTLSDEAAQARALREADSLKNALLSLVSHELRTPLASIKASASGLLQDGTRWNQETFVEALQAINDESDRLTEMVSKLLDLSRLEAGAWRPQCDWCDLVDVLGTALTRLPHQENRRIQVCAAPDLPLIRADSVQIAQVMTNLLENALKYAPPGTPVTVTLGADHNRVRVDITDAGFGIPAGEVEAIFERFHRLPCHRQSGLPGTGLGLAICRGIIEAHGGQIWEHNAPSGGAIFTFALPRPDEPLTAPDSSGQSESGAEVAGVSDSHLGG